ncbi:MAG: hypothetical protein V1909_00935, partial [Candidatus Micrarchaeota archaeon]
HDCKETKALIEKISSEVDTTSAKTELDRLAQELASMKCCSPSFEVMPDELSNVDLTFLTTRSAETRDRLGAVKRSLLDKYKIIAKKRTEEMDSAMKELLSAGYSIESLYSKFEAMLSRDASNLDELIEKEEELFSLAKEALGECLEEAKRIAGEESTRKGATEVKNSLGKINISEAELPKLASELSILRKKLQSIMGGDFSTVKNSLINSLDSTINASKGEGLTDFREKLNKLRDSVSQLNDPGKLGKIREHEKEYRELVKISLAELSIKLKELAGELSEYKPPREMTPKLPQIESPSGNLAEFAKKLSSILKELSPGMDELIRNVRIMRSYQKVERLIDARLSESRKVSAKDLDIRYPELLFMLYKKKHPKVKFTDSPEPKLFED